MDRYDFCGIPSPTTSYHTSGSSIPGSNQAKLFPWRSGVGNLHFPFCWKVKLPFPGPPQTKNPTDGHGKTLNSNKGWSRGHSWSVRKWTYGFQQGASNDAPFWVIRRPILQPHCLYRLEISWLTFLKSTGMLRSMFRKYTNMHVLSICNGSNHGSEMRSCGLLVHIYQEEIKTHQIIYIWLNWISKRPTIDLKFNTPYTYVYIYIFIPCICIWYTIVLRRNWPWK